MMNKDQYIEALFNLDLSIEQQEVRIKEMNFRNDVTGGNEIYSKIQVEKAVLNTIKKQKDRIEDELYKKDIYWDKR